MKKILAIALVLLLVVALAVPAFAAQGSETGPGPDTNGKTPAGGPGKSPQTGYNTVLWGIAAAAMAVCAGYCFSKSGKKAAC